MNQPASCLGSIQLGIIHVTSFLALAATTNEKANDTIASSCLWSFSFLSVTTAHIRNSLALTQNSSDENKGNAGLSGVAASGSSVGSKNDIQPHINLRQNNQRAS
ncbi:hypothetical protein TRVL_06445 [Trypanosoma vivax]|nr:hypothetical protein TRVL_06445 [Trypanosoma vivax]